MKVAGNLPPTTTFNGATEYFDNFFKSVVPVSQNVDDAVIGFFETITGERQSATTLASAILYTAVSRGLDPMEFLDELRRLKTGKITEELTPIDAALFVSSYNSYPAIVEDLDQYENEQLFYNPTLNVFYQKTQGSLVTVLGYKAERVVTITGELLFNYFRVQLVREENELSAYLTMLLNLDRVNTSLLGISNQPQTNKYIQRAILP